MRMGQRFYNILLLLIFIKVVSANSHIIPMEKHYWTERKKA